MIVVTSLTVKSFRGIRSLLLKPEGQNFAICGSNGTGKSGVVDAIEFAVTGSVTRLTGQGTAGISLKSHGPHVDMRDKPKEARVILEAFAPALKKKLTIERGVDAPNEPIVQPEDPDVLALVQELARHPEFALSRREIVKYVIAAPGDRSKEVQALLRLDSVEKVRASFQNIANTAKAKLKQGEQVKQEASTQLLKALGIPAMKKQMILDAVNQRRQVLNLEPLVELQADTSLKSGLGVADSPSTKLKVSKTQAVADLKALEDEIKAPEPTPVAESRVGIAADFEKLLSAPALLKSLRREEFLQTGLQLFEDDDAACPFCDSEWDLEALRTHVQQRLALAQEARETKQLLQDKAQPLLQAMREFEALLGAMAKHGANLPTPVDVSPITAWTTALSLKRQNLLVFDRLKDKMTEMLEDYRSGIAAIQPALECLRSALALLPDASKEDEARDYLVLCQERLEVYREAARQAERLKLQQDLAQKALDIYGTTSSAVLAQIYSDVEKDFTEYYRYVNRDDEEDFEGKLVPSLGKLGFDVDFYGRGLFPPGAYHSEGHQDGMGLCLYLALMKHTLKDGFTFAVLDDVLMSIDAGHRREICSLLKSKFPNTQFVITTHDPIWLQHLATEKMISSKSMVHFRKWTVEDGPLLWEGGEVWEEISRDLENDDVPSAAGRLRRFLEFMSGLLAHKLRATAEYRSDAAYDLGDLLPSVISAWTKHLSKAQESAQSWKKKEESSRLSILQSEFKSRVQQTNVEQWAINKSIHYNEWAQLKREDFVPVVESFKALLDCFHCSSCGGVVYVSPSKGPKESVRCDCGTIALNLKVQD
jgi:tetratricopeptide (TPR) repeat protein